jgi:hypothetical protein
MLCKKQTDIDKINELKSRSRTLGSIVGDDKAADSIGDC